MGRSKVIIALVVLAGLLALAVWTCRPERGALAATEDFVGAVREGHDTDACALVVAADANPSRCARIISVIRSSGLENPVFEVTRSYGHGAGAYVIVRGRDGRRMEVHLIRSRDPRAFEHAAEYRWYIVEIRDLPNP